LRRDDTKGEEMQKMALKLARKGNESEIVEQVKEMIEDKHLVSTFKCISNFN